MTDSILPEVSVVMSCYNAGKTVNKAIQSIIDQSFEEFEFIIVEDGSSDDTLSILTKWQKKDKRITIIINNKNLGLAGSLNKGIKASKAKLIARMDADDWAYPNRLQRQLCYMKDHTEVDILGSAVMRVDDHDRDLGINQLPENHESIVTRVFKKPLVYHPTIMIKRNVYESLGWYNEKLRWAEDADLWYRIYDEVRFHNLPDVLLRYRVKSRLNNWIIYNNLRIKAANLDKRGLLWKYSPYLLKDFVTMSLKRITNF